MSLAYLCLSLKIWQNRCINDEKRHFFNKKSDNLLSQNILLTEISNVVFFAMDIYFLLIDINDCNTYMSINNMIYEFCHGLVF